jgi:hypothetical protein
MSMKLRDGLMVAFAAGGVLALAATAEFGIPAALVGAGISAVSGVMAVQRNHEDAQTKPLHNRRNVRIRSQRRAA